VTVTKFVEAVTDMRLLAGAANLVVPTLVVQGAPRRSHGPIALAAHPETAAQLHDYVELRDSRHVSPWEERMSSLAAWPTPRVIPSGSQ
jgi:hypothetical protein